MCSELQMFINNEYNYCTWNLIRVIEDSDNRSFDSQGSTVIPNVKQQEMYNSMYFLLLEDCTINTDGSLCSPKGVRYKSFCSYTSKSSLEYTSCSRASAPTLGTPACAVCLLAWVLLQLQASPLKVGNIDVCQVYKQIAYHWFFKVHFLPVRQENA